MLDLKFVASIAERDVDFLVMEELSVSTEFREWFASRVFGEPTYRKEIGAWHSVSDPQYGESDIIFLFEAVDGPRTAILIENKIDAPPQPQQGERYRLRGEKGLKEGYWEKFKSCVIAPAKYLNSAKHTENYSVEISYEEILAYFQSRSSRGQRYPYKAKVLLEGIEQNRRGYQPAYNEEITKFVTDYFEYCSGDYAMLGMQESKPRPAGSTWIMFYPKSLPNEISLVHQMTAGFVKVLFYGQAEEFDNLKKKFSPILPSDAIIEIAGKSVAISIEVAKLEPLSFTFEAQRDKVNQALLKLVLLEELVAKSSAI